MKQTHRAKKRNELETHDTPNLKDLVALIADKAFAIKKSTSDKKSKKTKSSEKEKVSIDPKDRCQSEMPVMQRQSSCKNKAAGVVVQKDLVSSTIFAKNADPELVNAWGIARTHKIFWVASNAKNELIPYDRNGSRQGFSVRTVGNGPTGLVRNTTCGFEVPTSRGLRPALLLLVTEAGTFEGWHPALTPNTTTYKFFTNTDASYTSLAVVRSSAFLANFANTTIEEYKSTSPTAMVREPFTDPALSARGYGAYGLANIHNLLYAAFAQLNEEGDNQAGEGLGHVVVFSTRTRRFRNLIDNGALNGPWGMAAVPCSFIFPSRGGPEFSPSRGGPECGPSRGGPELSPLASRGPVALGAECRHKKTKCKPCHEKRNVLLVGNFSSGTIEAYTLKNGCYLGRVFSCDRCNPVSQFDVPGLWGLLWDPLRRNLFFAAGTAGETQGLFGRLDQHCAAHRA